MTIIETLKDWQILIATGAVGIAIYRLLSKQHEDNKATLKKWRTERRVYISRRDSELGQALQILAQHSVKIDNIDNKTTSKE